MNLQFNKGDIIESVSPHSLAKTAKIVAITEQSFTAEVIEGANTKDPLIVFRAGWSMYRKVPKKCILHPTLDGDHELNVPCAPGGKVSVCKECHDLAKAGDKTRLTHLFSAYRAEHGQRIAQRERMN